MNALSFISSLYQLQCLYGSWGLQLINLWFRIFRILKGFLRGFVSSRLWRYQMLKIEFRFGLADCSGRVRDILSFIVDHQILCDYFVMKDILNFLNLILSMFWDLFLRLFDPEILYILTISRHVDLGIHRLSLPFKP